MDVSSHWSTGVLIWGPIAVVLTIGLIVGGMWLLRWSDRIQSPVDASAIRWCGRGVLILVPVFILANGCGFWPYQAEYHKWEVKSGVVEKIDKRLVSSGDSGMEEKLVVRFAGDSQQYGCLDTRCASVSEGDELALLCKRAWEWAATDGYDCKWGSYVPKED